MVSFEEKDQYQISGDREKNRVIIDFIGESKDPAKIPKYNDHVRQAIKEVTRGFTTLVIIAENTKPPKLGITKMMRESQQDLLKGGVSKTAVYIPPKLVLQRMTLKVVTKLTGMNLKAFDDKDKAFEWLDQEEAE